jgi:hypothetical protein
MDRRTSICVWGIGIIAMRLVLPDGVGLSDRMTLFAFAMVACAGAYFWGKASAPQSPDPGQ